MDPRTKKQVKALMLVVDAMVEIIKEAGPDGAPEGTLYAALMGHGCTLESFQRLVSLMIASGRVRRGALPHHLVAAEGR